MDTAEITSNPSNTMIIISLQAGLKLIYKPSDPILIQQDFEPEQISTFASEAKVGLEIVLTEKLGYDKALYDIYDTIINVEHVIVHDLVVDV